LSIVFEVNYEIDCGEEIEKPSERIESDLVDCV